jgi:predicted amidophosphoribosyltransferase
MGRCTSSYKLDMVRKYHNGRLILFFLCHKCKEYYDNSNFHCCWCKIEYKPSNKHCYDCKCKCKNHRCVIIIININININNTVIILYKKEINNHIKFIKFTGS